MTYPTTIETLRTDHADNVGEAILAATDNEQARVLNAIMNELGTNPSGDFATVAAKLLAIFTESDPKSNGDVLAYDSGLGRFKPTSLQGVPTGVMLDYLGTSAPTGWVIGNGSLVTRNAPYAGLFALFGFAFTPGSPGSDPGSNNFYLPDTRGRVSVGLGTHTDVDAIGDTDGISTVAQRRVKHKHVVNDPGHFHTEQAPAGTTAQGSSAPSPNTSAVINTSTATTGITVGPQTDSPTDGPAYIVVSKIIKL